MVRVLDPDAAWDLSGACQDRSAWTAKIIHVEVVY